MIKFKTFHDFLELKEGNEEVKKTSHNRTLDKEDAFYVDRNNYPHLIPLINAFNDSKEVRLGDFLPGGYKTASKDGKLEEPKLKSKELWLVGGAVRDHFMGRKIKDLDLATDATVSEIRMILLSKGFVEKDPHGSGQKEKNDKIKRPPGVRPNPNWSFYVTGWDKQANEFTVTVEVNGEKMELSTFREDSKGATGRIPDKMSVSDLTGDANRRDLTMNALYIKLNKADGPNTTVADPHGALTDIRDGKGKARVRFIGKASERLDEDPLRAFRYVRMYVKYGEGTLASLPEEYKDLITKMSKKGFKNPRGEDGISKERAREEFLKGLEDDDVDPKKYIRLYKELGFLNHMFPKMEFQLDGPQDYTTERDRFVALAWILRKNDPKAVAQVLHEGKWTNEEVKKIVYLVKVLKFTPDIDGSTLMQMHSDNPWAGSSEGDLPPAAYQQFAKDGGRMERLMRQAGMPIGHISALRDYLSSPMTKVYDQEQNLNPDYSDLLDPFSQQVSGPQVGERKREIELRRLAQLLKKHHEAM